MTTDYITTEFKSIMEDKTWEFPLNTAMACTWAIGNLKGINLKVLDLDGKSSLAEYFVIGSATNSTQAQSMATTIIKQLKHNGVTNINCEGLSGQDWILVDTGDIIIHIFLDTAREAYDLDSVWNDSKTIEIPESFYFEAPQESQVSNEEKSYF